MSTHSQGTGCKTWLQSHRSMFQLGKHRKRQRQAPCCRCQERSEGRHFCWTGQRPADSGRHCMLYTCSHLSLPEHHSMCPRGTWSNFLVTGGPSYRSTSQLGNQCKPMVRMHRGTGSIFQPGSPGRHRCWLPPARETMSQANTPCIPCPGPSPPALPTDQPGTAGKTSALGKPPASSTCQRGTSSMQPRQLRLAYCSKCQEDSACTQSSPRHSMCPRNTRRRPCSELLGILCPAGTPGPGSLKTHMRRAKLKATSSAT